ncbi:hypothetical protein JTB14_008687 [Gonioctena quinquepunctata]|nr:hypothetical protein JTB14_008687 [Gonioctena quinquepunctata]
MWGHATINCSRDPRCMKCAGDHQTKQCSKSGNIVAKCANCDGPHRSNYYECPTYIRRVQQIQERKAHPKQKTGQPQYINAPLPKESASKTPDKTEEINNREQTRPSRGRIDASEEANSQRRGPREDPRHPRFPIHSNAGGLQWAKEYSPNLTKRSKWTDDNEQIKEGDIVIIVDDKAARNSWTMGKIEKLFTGPDGRVRVADVKMRTSTYP